MIQLDREIKDAKKASLDLKQEMKSLPNVDFQQMKKDLDQKISEINDAKEELDKAIAYAIETKGKFRISDYDRETVNKHSTEINNSKNSYHMILTFWIHQGRKCSYFTTTFRRLENNMIFTSNQIRNTEVPIHI